MELSGEYKGYKIIVNENSNGFIARIGESTICSIDLSELMKKIDSIEKKNFERTPIIYDAGWRTCKFKTGVVTSHYNEKEIWISIDGGTRQKLNTSNVYLKTPENKLKIIEIQSREKQIKDIQAEIKYLRGNLEIYKITEE